MPRITTPALDARLAAQTTAVGYLVRIEQLAAYRAPATTLQICDIGETNNASLGTFVAEAFAVQGAGSQSASLAVQNVNGAMGAFVLQANPLAGVPVTIWQFERGAPNDAVLLGKYVTESADVGIDQVVMRLNMKNTKYKFAPSRRINYANGFRFALRPGEVFLWGSQRVLIRERGK
jgi:hypothetical protein